MAKTNRATVIATVGVLVSFIVFNGNSQEIYNLKIPTSKCSLVPTVSCFNTKAQKSFDVGSEVTSLDQLYTFCTQVSTLTTGKPARIILTLDASGSMCMEVTGCAGATKNDPTNKRVEGAIIFVDSIAKKCGACEIGVIVYTGVANDTTGANTIIKSLSPLRVTADNIPTILDAINAAKCTGAGGGMGKALQETRLAKRALTFTGMALDSAIKMVDANYSAIADSLDRHIVLLTDGDWQVPTTATILVKYATNFPGRKLPVVHSVFISDSAAHVAAGFPPQGEVTCTKTDTVPMDLSNLKLIANTTGGLYFPGSTPQTIASTFNALFVQITHTVISGLTSVVFIDSTTGETHQATFSKDTGGAGNQFIVNVPVFGLKYGRNKFSTIMSTKDSSGFVKTETDTFSVFRHDTPGTGTTQVFSTQCSVDTVNMNIRCKPGTMLINEFDTVNAKVAPADADRFVPNNVVVRAFVPFPDGSDTRVLALFHFDDKTLANSAPNGQPGTGSPAFSSDAAFGNAIGSGSFTTNAALAISGDFTFECWIRPGVSTRTASIVSGGGFSFGVADGYLTTTIGAATIRTTNAIDTAVWQHVAIARINGSANIYINGIPMAMAASAAGSISGALTIGNFTGGALDEVRISSFVSAYAMQGKTLLQIPTADNLSWNIKQSKSTSPSGILPQDMWQGSPRGQLQFQYSNTMYGPTIINFFDTLSSPALMWSKNGDPVLFWSTGVLVSATLKDTSHDGHLDLIDIAWTDDIAIKTVPDVSQFIVKLQIKTLDGNKDVTLHATTLVADPAKKMFHIILAENQDPAVLETGWVNPVITVSEVKITSEGKWFIVNKVIDGAAPIPKSACYGTSATADSLRIVFSEPIDGADIDLGNLIRIDQNSVRTSLSALQPTSVLKSGALETVIFKPKTIQALVQNIEEIFPGEKSSPLRNIDYCIGPTAIPVQATLRDTSHDGHLDLIDIKWTDDITIKTLPDANQFITKLQVKTLDGNKDVTLHAARIVLDSVSKTIHIILAENQDPLILETGWSGSAITLNQTKITTTNRWLAVDTVLDGAAPIPKSVCFGFTPAADTLHVFFSEPIEKAGIDLKNLIRVDQNGTRNSLVSLDPKNTGASGTTLTIVFSPKTIQPTQTIEEQFPGEKSSPARSIDYCRGGPIIENIQVGPNPFIPGISVVKNKPGVFIKLDLFIPSKIAKGTYIIFDAVGNVLADNVPMDPEGAFSISTIWDGKNKKGVYAAGGTYLIRAHVENTLTGQLETVSGKIGIRTHKN